MFTDHPHSKYKSSQLVIRETKPLALETNDILDVFNLTLEEISAFLELIRVAIKFHSASLQPYLCEHNLTYLY